MKYRTGFLGLIFVLVMLAVVPVQAFENYTLYNTSNSTAAGVYLVRLTMRPVSDEALTPISETAELLVIR